MSGSSDERYLVVSGDCHAGASVAAYKPYLEKRWHEEFDAWAADFHDPWEEVDAGLEPREIKMGVANFDSAVNWDTPRRQQILEGEGIAAEVVFPNTAPPFFPSGVLTVSVPQNRAEYERRMAGLRAHNRWLVDFCAEVPGRRAGVAQVFLNDIDEAIDEIRWIKEAGLKGGILLPGDGQGGLVPLYHPRLDPLWALCEELEVPVHRHSNLPGEPIGEINGSAGSAIGLVESSFFAHRGLAHLIFAGVFERFPNLRFMFTESGAFWVPSYLAELDAMYDGALMKGSIVNYFAGPAAEANLTRHPSDYFASNVWVAASFLTPAESGIRHDIGVNKVIWGSDLPHVEGTFPYTLEALRATFANVPVEETREMIGQNACGVYGFDAVELQKVADRIGPKVADVHRPLTDAERPRTPEDTVCPALAHMPMPGYIESTGEAFGEFVNVGKA
jgi:predicted TIM-barrel fold metal-dependent hydrolase